MAADVARFEGAIDKVYKTVSTQELQFDPKEMRGLSERGAIQYVEQKFQQQLQRARAAFLQEFRNHSVVVDREAKKIREALTEQLEAKYGERISQLKAEASEASSTISKLKEEIAQLKSLIGAQECYLASVRHRLGLESKDRLRSELQLFKDELEAAKQENADLNQQLMCRDELVARLNQELGGMDGQLKNQAHIFGDEKKGHEEVVRGLKLEMQMMQEQFARHLHSFEEQFAEYRSKTQTELEIQDILNRRRQEALRSMEEERQLHIKARTKPTARIGEEGLEPHVEARCTAYAIADAKYRVDDMGMDTAWRDYELNDLQLIPNKKVKPPKFRVERIRKAAQRANTNAVAPTATDTPREEPRPTSRLREVILPNLPPAG